MNFLHLRISTPFTSLAATVIATLLLLTACGGGGGGGGGGNGGGAVVGLSQHGSTNSHNDSRRGTDCMGCHTSSGPGSGAFITAGTSMTAAGGYVEYYADMARTDLHARLEIDAYGNFYTVTAIDLLTPNGSGFSPGAYVTIVMPNGSRRNMPGNISHTSASCNECHSAAGTQSSL